MTYDDLKVRCRLFVAEKQAQISQQFQSFYRVAKWAVGSEEGTKGASAVDKAKSDPNVNLMVPQSAAELAGAFSKVFG